MPWIRVIDENEATGKLRKIYEEVKQKRGRIAEIMKVHSLNPRTMKDHIDLYFTLMFNPSGLKREDREFIGVVVSAANKCEYCVKHHSEALNYYWKDGERIQKLIQDFKSLDLSRKTRRMAEYAVKLTKTPRVIDQADLDLLRECGFSDEDILNINLITSYFNFVNRIALGLGVESTLDEVKGYRY